MGYKYLIYTDYIGYEYMSFDKYLNYVVTLLELRRFSITNILITLQDNMAKSKYSN